LDTSSGLSHPLLDLEVDEAQKQVHSKVGGCPLHTLGCAELIGFPSRLSPYPLSQSLSLLSLGVNFTWSG
jgi:hypothetical protein